MRESHDEIKYAIVPQEAVSSPERTGEIGAMAFHDCENHLKELYVGNGERKIIPGQTADVEGFVQEAIRTGRIKKEEGSLYCDKFQQRYSLGYPIETN